MTVFKFVSSVSVYLFTWLLENCTRGSHYISIGFTNNQDSLLIPISKSHGIAASPAALPQELRLWHCLTSPGPNHGSCCLSSISPPHILPSLLTLCTFFVAVFNLHLGCLLYMPQTGIEPEIYVCALTRSRTFNLLAYGMTLQPIEAHWPGLGFLCCFKMIPMVFSGMQLRITISSFSVYKVGTGEVEGDNFPTPLSPLDKLPLPFKLSASSYP